MNEMKKLQFVNDGKVTVFVARDSRREVWDEVGSNRPSMVIYATEQEMRDMGATDVPLPVEMPSFEIVWSSKHCHWWIVDSSGLPIDTSQEYRIEGAKVTKL